MLARLRNGAWIARERKYAWIQRADSGAKHSHHQFAAFCWTVANSVVGLSPQVHDGLIWVYGSCEPGAEEEAAKNVPQELQNAEIEDPNYDGFRLPWFSRALPYSVETLLENVRLSTSPCN